MGKKVEFYNLRVAVYPISYRKSGPTRDDCVDIEREIKRHVDGVESIKVEYDRKEVCSFCGRKWATLEDGCPSCCTDAIEEWEKETEKSA
jgi:hypothetical protein